MDYEKYFSAFGASIPFTHHHERALCALKNRLKNEGILSFQSGMKAAYDHALLSLAEHGVIPEYLPYCPKGLFVGIDPAHVLNFLACFNKLEVVDILAPEPWDTFKVRMREVENFTGFDLHRALVPFDESFSLSLRLVRSFCALLLGRAPTRVICKHGPGATAEKLISWDKWLSVFEDGKIRLSPQGGLRMVSVPKDASGRRLIGIEPCSRQFIQQGLARALRETRFFKKYVNLSSNVEHVQRASNDSYCTIDLKDASDRISPSLVENLLPSSWYKLFAEFSSSFACLPSGENLRLGCMATMGNGFCFELETLIFKLLSIIACRPTTMSEVEHYAEQVSVYGDDIVAPEWALPAVRHVFQVCGLVLNPKKTCLTRFFKETVGYWIINGVAVRRFTPRLKGSRTSLVFDSDVSRQSLAESALGAGYWALGRDLSLLSKRRSAWDPDYQVHTVQLSAETCESRRLHVPERDRLNVYFLTGGRTPLFEDTRCVLESKNVPVWAFPFSAISAGYVECATTLR